MDCIRRQPAVAVAAVAAAFIAGLAMAQAAEQPRVAPPTSHDGVYAVEILTLRGTCDPVYHWTINVAAGRVTSPADGFMQASGQIDARGVVSLAFRRDEQVANVAGRVQGRRGSGIWSSATLQCAGSWSAVLQG
jgi:hypothetical protein